MNPVNADDTPNSRAQIGGGGAVSTTVASTKQSVAKIQRRGAAMLSRSEVGGVTDFSRATSKPTGFSSFRWDRRRVGIKSTGRSFDGGVNLDSVNDGSTGEASAGSSAERAIDSQSGVSRAYGGSSVMEDGQVQNEPKEHAEEPSAEVRKKDQRTMGWRVGAFLTGLPLSKLKIVIGEIFCCLPCANKLSACYFTHGQHFRVRIF